MTASGYAFKKYFTSTFHTDTHTPVSSPASFPFLINLNPHQNLVHISVYVQFPKHLSLKQSPRNKLFSITKFFVA